MSEGKNARDEQFKGFAKALWDELINANESGYIDVNTDFDDGIDPTNYRQIIARRAYDLAFHVIDNSRANDMEDWHTEQIMPYVPDMIELPKEQEA